MSDKPEEVGPLNKAQTDAESRPELAEVSSYVQVAADITDVLNTAIKEIVQDEPQSDPCCRFSVEDKRTPDGNGEVTFYSGSNNDTPISKATYQAGQVVRIADMRQISATLDYIYLSEENGLINLYKSNGLSGPLAVRLHVHGDKNGVELRTTGSVGNFTVVEPRYSLSGLADRQFFDLQGVSLYIDLHSHALRQADVNKLLPKGHKIGYKEVLRNMVDPRASTQVPQVQSAEGFINVERSALSHGCRVWSKDGLSGVAHAYLDKPYHWIVLATFPKVVEGLSNFDGVTARALDLEIDPESFKYEPRSEVKNRAVVARVMIDGFPIYVSVPFLPNALAPITDYYPAIINTAMRMYIQTYEPIR